MALPAWELTVTVANDALRDALPMALPDAALTVTVANSAEVFALAAT